MTAHNGGNPNNHFPYQEQSLYLLWSIGDWSALTRLDPAAYAKDVESLCYIAAAFQQSGDAEKSVQLVQHYHLAEKAPRFLVNLVLAGAYNSLARARTLNNNADDANALYSQSLQQTSPLITPAIIDARILEQQRQLGIPKLAKPDFVYNAPNFSQFAEEAQPYFLKNIPLAVAQAEDAMQRQDYQEAIVAWQKVTSLMGERTPQAYYDRLKNAYKNVQGFPPGTTEQEQLQGKADKHEFLKRLHERLKPRFYFEIGVQTGKSLALAECEALGIDPMPMLRQQLGQHIKVLSISSDAFFAHKSDVLIGKNLDLVFIDGMHLFEYTLRDFINTEKYSHRNTIIVIDDIFPVHQDQAKRARCTRAWTGDVWKIIPILKKYRPDLNMMLLDIYPTGLLIISSLDNSTNTLDSKFAEILEAYLPLDNVPEPILARTDVLDSKTLDSEGYVELAINEILKFKC